MPPRQHVVFDLDGDVPFRWNRADPTFSVRLNALSVVVAAAEGLGRTCRAKLCEGTVEMATAEALLPSELRDNYVLTCQSRPTTERLVVDYDR